MQVILHGTKMVTTNERERRLDMEVKNGIIIDGVLHELVETKSNDCLTCSLHNLCSDFGYSPLCWIALDSDSEIKNEEFKCRGKVTNIEIEEENQ